MDVEKFIKTIIGYYEESRKLTIDANGFDIWRGVSHSISSQSEDLFALMVAQELTGKSLKDKSLKFLVDVPFSLQKKDKKSEVFRPDLAIIKDNKLLNIIDLKMDMGYKRDYHNTEEFETVTERFEHLKKGIGKVRYTQNSTKVYVEAHKDIINQIVVVSAKNMGDTKRKEMTKGIKSVGANIYYLSGGAHPNDKKPKLEKLQVDQDEFNRLAKDIRKTH